MVIYTSIKKQNGVGVPTPPHVGYNKQLVDCIDIEVIVSQTSGSFLKLISSAATYVRNT